jgi:pantoate kinase
VGTPKSISVGKGVTVGEGVKVSVDVGKTTGVAVREATTGCVRDKFLSTTATLKLHEWSRDAPIAIKIIGTKYPLIRMTTSILKEKSAR